MLDFLYLKPLLFSILSLPILNNAPEIMDLVSIERHAMTLQYVALIIRNPSMMISMQKICKDKHPKEFIRLMQTPPPSISKINLYFYPEAIEIAEGKRCYDEKKYLQIRKEVKDLLEQENLNLEKYEYSYDDPLQQELNLTIKTQLYQAIELKKIPLIYKDNSFKSLLVSMIMLIALARFNAEKKDFRYALDLGMFAEQMNYFFEILTTIGNDSEKLSFSESKDLLENLVKNILTGVHHLNKRIDRFIANCKHNEHYIILNDLRRINEVTQEILSCFGIQIT